MHTIKSSIILKLSIFIVSLFISSISYAQLVVDGIDLMEGFTFGAAAETFNPADFAGRHWTVTRIDDPDPFATEAEMYGSLRWAINKTNQTPGTNYIDFNLPDGSVIYLETTLPIIISSVIIDGKPELNSSPKIIIDGRKMDYYDNSCMILNGLDYGVIQGLHIRNFRHVMLHFYSSPVKTLSNILNNDEDFHTPYNDVSATSCIRLTGSPNNFIKGNIIGTDLNLNLNYSYRTYGIYSAGDLNLTVGEELISDRNVFSNVSFGIWSATGWTSYEIDLNQQYKNNLFYNVGNFGDLYYSGFGVALHGGIINNEISKNIFYKTKNLIRLLQNANNNKQAPQIKLVDEITGNVVISGFSSQENDHVEIYLSTENVVSVIKYLGTAVANVQDEIDPTKWKWQLVQGGTDWEDPTFYLKPGQKILATATDIFNNTSTFSSAFAVTNISERALSFIPACSSNPALTRRWKVSNYADTPINCEYVSPIDQSNISYIAPQGESFMAVSINDPLWNETILLTYNYEGSVNNIVLNTTLETCAGISCEFYDFTLTPQHVFCTDENTGAVNVDLMGAPLISFNWLHGADQLNLANEYADRYTLTITVLDDTGNECVKTKSVEILEADVIINIEIGDIVGCDNTGTVDLVGVSVIPIDGNESLYNCQFVPENEYSATGCEFGEKLFGTDDAIISAGETMVIPEGFLFEGKLTINGGKLVVCGYLSATSLSFNSGEIVVNGSIEQTNLTIPSGSSFQNFGTIECDYITVSGDLININNISCLKDLTINSSGSIVNYGDINVNGDLYNQSQVDNYREMYASNNFHNQIGSQFNNYCRFNSKKDFINSGILNNQGLVYIWENFINEASGEVNVLEGAEFVINILENNGVIKTDPSNCFCFTVLSGAELNENSSIFNQFLSQGNGNCNCSYSTGEAYNAKIVELDKERITPTNYLSGLSSGEHEIAVDINGCEVGMEFEVNGGLYFEVMADQTICEGNEIYLVCEVIGEGSGTTITWDNQESIIDYTPNQSIQLVKPDVTTIYTINVLTPEGCAGSKIITVHVIPSPEITMINDTSICNGENVILNVTTTVPVTYSWTPSESLSADNIKNPVATPKLTTDYEVLVTETSSGYNCTSTGNLQIEVKPTPIVTIAIIGNSGNCENTNVQLEASGAVSYSWSPTDGLSNDTVSNPVASPSITTEYTVTGTAENGCDATASTIVEMVEKPDFQIGVDETDCIAPQRHLYLRGGGVSFSWSPSESLNNPNIAEPIATITKETVFTVEITTENGCKYLEQITVNMPSWPIAENVTIGFGETAQLNATGGVDGTYSWSPVYGLNKTDIPNPVSNVQATTAYSLTAENTFGCENTINVYVYVDPTGRCLELNTSGITYYWTGNAGNRDWNNPANWDEGTGSLNIPGSDPSQDNVIIDFLSGDTPNYPRLNQDIEIHRICFKGGTLDLANHTLSINGDATFTGGEITGITNVNNEALKLVLDGSDESQSVYFGNVMLNCNVTVLSSPEIFLNGATFNGFTILEQNGNTEVACMGGNIFNYETQIINSGTGDWRLAYINEGSGDKYIGDVTFALNSSGGLYPNASFQDEFKGDIYIEGDGILFGSNGGVTLLNADVDQYIGGQVSIAPPVFRKLIVEKNLTDEVEVDLAYSDIYLEIPIQVGLHNEIEDKLVLKDGIIFTTEENIIIISNGVKVEGTSNLSFIDGPVKKIGNEDFIFPVGKIDRYMPIKISNAGSLKPNTEFIAEFLEEVPDGLLAESLEDISSCEYWRLTKPLNDADNVSVTLCWDRNSCDISTDVTKLKVTSLNATTWMDLGISDYTGSKSEGGSIISEIAATHFEAFAIGSEIIPGYGPTVGMSFNNYGAIITITDCDVYVNGNVLNEKDDLGNLGEFIFSSTNAQDTTTLLIANDWTNNAQKTAFGTGTGRVYFDGNYQRIRGSQPTEFNQLWLAGFGKKEMFNDVDVSNKLNLFDNQLETREYSLFINTNQFDAIENKTGYVSSLDQGHIARIVAAKNTESYLFPIGGHYLYRPIYLTPLNDGDDYDDIFRMRFIYHNPTNHGANTDFKAASVVDVNQNFFYEIEKDEGTGDSDFFSLEMRYNKAIDGAFQSIGHWNPNPKTEFIGDTVNDMIWLKLSRIKPRIDFVNDVIPNILTLDSVSDFNFLKFALIKGAFIINTDNFGDPFGDGSNVDFTVGDGYDTGGEIYDSENPGNDIGQPVAPEDMEVEHVMEIFGDPLTVGGYIIIRTDGNGDIKLMDDSEDQYQIYFMDNGVQKPLAKNLYTVKNGNVLQLYQEPRDLEIKCNTELKVSFSNADPIVFSRSNPQFTITGLGSDKIEKMWIINTSTGVRTEADSFSWNGAGISANGIYKFELDITTKTGTQKFKGQFIVQD